MTTPAERERVEFEAQDKCPKCGTTTGKGVCTSPWHNVNSFERRKRAEINPLHWLQSKMFPYKPDIKPPFAAMGVNSEDAKQYGDMRAQAARREERKRCAERIEWVKGCAKELVDLLAALSSEE